MRTSPGLSAWDYVVVSAMLFISMAIGVAFTWKQKKQQNTQDLLLGGREMGRFPVTMSLMASFISAIMILATTSEFYLYGLIFFIYPLCFLLLLPITVFLFIPVFYNMKITSVYQYLENRFHSRFLRKACSAAFMVQMLLYMAVVLYAPSLAINAIMGFNVWLSVIVCGVVCTLYTSLGGLKAVMWTDVFQVIMMVGGLLVIIIEGFISLGGVSEVLRINLDLGRLTMDDLFQFSPTKRYDIYSAIIGGVFTWLPIYSINQAQIQRAVACPTLKSAQIAFLINMPGMILLQWLGSTVGLVVLAYYKDCDPILDGTIQSADQLLPLYVIQELSKYPGVPGLFMAAVFSGSLSTLSSGMNSITTVIVDDFILPCLPELSSSYQTLVAKSVTVILGILIILLTFVAAMMGSLAKVALMLFGMIGGPILGVFALGIFFPPANSKGAIAGLLIGLAQQLWVGIGAVIYGVPFETLSRSTDGCNSTMDYNATWDEYYIMPNSSTAGFVSSTCNNCTYVDDTETIEGFRTIYCVTYMWYGFIGVTVTTLSGLIISFVTGRTKAVDINPQTLSPLTIWMCGFNSNDTDMSDSDLELTLPLRS